MPVCMGSVSVLSCICCKFVSCVHPVAVLDAEFCMTLQFANAGRGFKRSIHMRWGRGWCTCQLLRYTIPAIIYLQVLIQVQFLLYIDVQ